MSKAHAHDDEPARRFADALRRAGLRVTQVRVRVLEVLNGAEHALQAQQVFEGVEGLEGQAVKGGSGGKRKPKVDRVTVYRTLNTLVEHGLAHKVDPGDRVFRFHITDHARCTHERHDHEHPHFMCDSCGTVECLEGAQVLVRPAQEKIGQGLVRDPARVVKQDVLLHGTCGKCVEAPNEGDQE